MAPVSWPAWNRHGYYLADNMHIMCPFYITIAIPPSLFLVPLLHGLSLRSRPRILYMILTATIRIQSISDSWTDGQIGNTTYEISKIERHRFMNCSSWRSCTVKPPLAVTERSPNKSDGYVTKRAVSSLICGGRAAQYNVGLSGRFR